MGLATVWRRLHGGLDSFRFRRLVQTHALSSAGDALVAVALAGSIFFSEDPNTARSRVALSLVLTMAPFAVVAPFLGPAVDRVRGGRRLVLLGASSARALLCLLMAGALDQNLLYPLAFASLVFSKTHAVAKSASVPELIDRPEALVRANSVLQIVAVVSSFCTAAIGYALGRFGGDEWVLRAAALVFSAGAAFALEVGDTVTDGRPSLAADPLSGGADDVVRRSGVRRAAAAMAVLRATVGFLTFLIAFDLRRDNAPTWWFGIAVAASLLGSSAGNLVAPHLRGRVREEWIVGGGIVAVAAAAAGAAQVSGRPAAAVFAGVVGACAGAAKLAFDSIVQRDGSVSAYGRAFGRFEAGFQLSWVAGALVPVTFTVATHDGYWGLATVCGLAALVYVARSLYQQRSGGGVRR